MIKQKFIEAYMKVAETFADLSTATRAKVGAIIVKDNRIISIGYNGMPSGWTNECEEREYMPADASSCLEPEDVEAQWPYGEEYEYQAGEYTGFLENGLPDPKTWQLTGETKTATRRYRLKTKPEVLHAEMNSLMKLAQSTESGADSSLFCTHSPCLDCAKGIYQAGIKEVYYKIDYRDNQGIKFLEKCGVKVSKV